MSLIFPLCFFCLFFTRSSDTIEQNETYISFFLIFGVVENILPAATAAWGCSGLGSPGGAAGPGAVSSSRCPWPPEEDRTRLCLSGCTSTI